MLLGGTCGQDCAHTSPASGRTTCGSWVVLPILIRPTLAKPTLANVKVLAVCKDFWFLGVNCFGFLKLIVQVFLCVLS